MSELEVLKQELSKTGKLYEDEDFPAEIGSIYYVHEAGQTDWKSIQWKRPKVGHRHYSQGYLWGSWGFVVVWLCLFSYILHFTKILERFV